MTVHFTEAQKTDIANRMAYLILHQVREKGDCTDDDLRDAGFTEREITQFGAIARGLAAIERNRANS